MPVRFACQQCGQKLSVKDDRAGKPVRCPKCQAKQIVPQGEQAETAGVSSPTQQASGSAQQPSAASAPVPPPPPPGGSEVQPPPGAAPPVEGAAPPLPPSEGAVPPPAEAGGVDFASLAAVEAGGEEGDMFAEFAVYDEPAEWVYEEEAEEHDEATTVTQKHYVAVPRKVLYVQGGLLAALAICGFLFGFLSGRLSVDPSQVNNRSRPANVSVVVLYHNDEGREVNDPHALVLIVPADQPIEEKLSRVGMSPSDPTLPENHPTFEKLKVIGGAMARTDDTGRCTLRVPRQGSYYLLCISQNAAVSGGAKPEDVAILGNYVLESYDLLDDTAYQLMQRNVTGNTKVNFRFD